MFSPRAGGEILTMYATMNDEAKKLSCITLAFGINKQFKDRLLDNTAISHIAFMLLEKKDAPAKPRKNAKKAPEPFVALTAKNNVYKAWGSFLDDPLYQWAKETTTRKMQLNLHVSYIHCKFLLVDPLGDDPIVVTGSANFSKASTNDNDENMILISRRSARRGHLFHRIQPALLPLLLSLGGGRHQADRPSGQGRPVPDRGRQLAQEI